MPQYLKRAMLLFLCLTICLPFAGCVKKTCEYCGEEYLTGLSVFKGNEPAAHGLGACADAAPCGVSGHYALKRDGESGLLQHARCELCGEWSCVGQHGEGVCTDQAPCGVSGHYLLKGQTTDADGQTHAACPLCGDPLCVGAHGPDVCISTDATLQSLTATDAAGNVLPLVPDFSPEGLSYTCSADKLYAGATVTVSGVANHPAATVTGGGAITLAEGENTVMLTVTAEDGTTTLTYTVILTAVVQPTPRPEKTPPPSQTTALPLD